MRNKTHYIKRADIDINYNNRYDAAARLILESRGYGSTAAMYCQMKEENNSDGNYYGADVMEEQELDNYLTCCYLRDLAHFLLRGAGAPEWEHAANKKELIAKIPAALPKYKRGYYTTLIKEATIIMGGSRGPVVKLPEKNKLGPGRNFFRKVHAYEKKMDIRKQILLKIVKGVFNYA